MSCGKVSGSQLDNALGKEDENFNRRNTWRILRINPPKFGGGLKFESDAGIGQKGAICKVSPR